MTAFKRFSPACEALPFQTRGEKPGLKRRRALAGFASEKAPDLAMKSKEIQPARRGPSGVGCRQREL